MSQKDNNTLEVIRVYTGSIMIDNDILNTYYSLKKSTKKQISNEVKIITKRLKRKEKEREFALFAVHINMLAVQEKIDPAVLLFTYIKDLNKNKKSTKKRRWSIAH